ncbi:FxSxx-COOH system tetratricopeptide repeat protein [Streptomyces sp. NPDC056361]|uniref:FxSxx-COOH system tetratricopeptide repeat protein n=1 Tax=Streptomyces sp. NPDC056361 TaxID=3345795 RepID=UPI0035E391A7
MDGVTAEGPEGDEKARDGGADRPVTAELVPLDALATDLANALLMGLRPIPDHVVGERRELAEALRRCFCELDTTLRRYAVQRRYSPSSVSRYLSGETTAPDHFLHALMDDVGKKLGRPMSPQARQALTRMQRAALKSTNTRAWQVQQLEDQLATALQEKALARTMADAVATSLLEHQERVATLEAERQALTEEVSAQRTAGIELNLLRAEQHRMLTDHQTLRRRVAELEAALEAAELRVSLAEQRCADLEHTLLAADAAAVAEEDADRLRTEERLARSQDELARLREEVASLRSDRSAEAVPEGEGDAHRPETPTGRPVVPDAVLHVTVVFAGHHRPWAAWIAQRLETHGHRATLQRWDPPPEVPLEQVLRDLLLARGQVLFVLDEWFFRPGNRPEEEWNDVLRGFVGDHAERFAAVNLTNHPLLPAAAVLEPVNLWGLTEETAGVLLLTRLALGTASAGDRRRPDVPPARYPDDPPAVWGAVPRRNPRFAGRDDLLNALQERFMAAERGGAACTLLGMSGIGKTQIAAEYAYRFSPDYDLVWWVHSDDRNVRLDRLGDLAAELGLPTGGDPGARVRAVREALRRGTPHGRWLVVFDGWDDTEAIEGLLPHGPGHVLITSRNRGWREHTDVLEVPGFDRRESTGYLMRRAPQLTAAEADEISAEFGDVPLPLAHAAAWLGESGVDAAEYLHRVREGLYSTVDDRSPGDDMPSASLTSWSILINRLRRSHPQALQVLVLCASFAPGPLPLGLLRTGPSAHLPEDVRWIATDQAAWTRALDTLVGYSVLTRVSADGAGSGPEEETVHMHRLVHDIVARLTDGEHHAAYRKAVRNLLAEADPGDPADPGHWPRYSVLLPHLEPSGALDSTAPRIQTTVLNCLRSCEYSGDYQEGIRLAGLVRQHWDAFMRPTEGPMPSRLTALEADLLRAAGRFREAHAQSLRALRDTTVGGRGPHGELAELYARGAVAAGLRHQGRYADARGIQQEVLERSVLLVGTDDPRTLAARHDLGITLRALGHYAEAYENDLVTLAVREEVLGGNHLAGLASANAVTRGRRLLGGHGTALVHQADVARRHRKSLGARHPQTLDADLELALCSRHSDPQHAGTALAELLDRAVAVHGRGHHVTLQCLTHYGNVLREQGDLDLARELVTEADTGYRTLLGPAHPVSFGAATNTALVLHASDERPAAHTMLESALAGLGSALGPDHPWTLGCALDTAAARTGTGDVASAVELGRDTLLRARQVLGNQHPLTLACRLGLASDLRALPGPHGPSAVEEAENLEEDAVDFLTQTQGAQHPHTLAARRRVRPTWEFEPHVD